MNPFIRNLGNDLRGSMAIETAIVAPVLILMALGTFEVSRVVSRQHELQSAASEAEIIAVAAAAGATTQTTTIKNILKTSLRLNDGQVAISRFYRCNANTTTVSSASNCSTGDTVSSYIRLTLTDAYTPVWTNFGVGSPINFNVVRTVQLS